MDGDGAQAIVRRIEPSLEFLRQFGRPDDAVITLDHPLGPVLPIGRKMTRPMTLSLTDRNFDDHECVAEAFDTTWNVLILLYPVRALTSTMIVLPSRFDRHNRIDGDRPVPLDAIVRTYIRRIRPRAQT